MTTVISSFRLKGPPDISPPDYLPKGTKVKRDDGYGGLTEEQEVTGGLPYGDRGLPPGSEVTLDDYRIVNVKDVLVMNKAEPSRKVIVKAI